MTTNIHTPAPHTDHLQMVSQANESNNREGLKRVGSCPCYFPYIESIPTSEFGTTTDIRRTPGMDM